METKEAEWVRVQAPGNFCNSQLNGSEGIVIARTSDSVTVLLMSGPDACRAWRFLPSHVVDALHPEGSEYVP
jgi:hypothetical protein